MKRNKTIICFTLALLLVFQGCNDELSKVANSNNPPIDVALGSEDGVLSFAKGGVFYSTFSSGTGASYFSTLDDGLGEGMLLIVYGMHDAMGDLIYVPWGNNNFKYVDNPTDFTLDDNSVVTMPIGTTQPAEMKLRNDRSYGATNGMLPEWTYMYTLNNVCNMLLSKLDATDFAGNAAVKRNILKAWAYWWKGYAYSRIGSMYIAGVITDEPSTTNGNFVTNKQILAEASKNLDKASEIIKALANDNDYSNVMNTLLPAPVKAGSELVKAGIPTPAEWLSNINSLKARNLMANTRVKDMTAADWQQILTLTEGGIAKGSFAFVARSYSDNSKSMFGKDDGHPGLAAALGGSDGTGTYFISERLIQDYRDGDLRFENNFAELNSPIINKRGRGLGFGTRYYLLDGGKGIRGTVTYAHTSAVATGKDDIFIASSYEENALMKAEALIRTGNVEGGLALIDEVREFQGAGLAATVGKGLTSSEALEELRSEKRISCFLRGISFYDARRNGVIDDRSVGGGRANAVVLSADESGMIVNTKAIINYNYLSYFDVPQNDLEFNPAGSGSAPVISPE